MFSPQRLYRQRNGYPIRLTAVWRHGRHILQRGMDGSVGLRGDWSRVDRHLHALATEIHRGQGQEAADLSLEHHKAIFVEYGLMGQATAIR